MKKPHLAYRESIASYFGWQILLSYLFYAAFLLLPDLAFAAGSDTPMGAVLCTTVGWMTGNTGKAIATLCVATLGTRQLLGKRMRSSSLKVLVGIAIIFAAAQVVDAMNAGAGSTCSTT